MHSFMAARFKNLFELPRETSSQPVALGFDNFFRGAFSYHFHNFWYSVISAHN